MEDSTETQKWKYVMNITQSFASLKQKHKSKTIFRKKNHFLVEVTVNAAIIYYQNLPVHVVKFKISNSWFQNMPEEIWWAKSIFYNKKYHVRLTKIFEKLLYFPELSNNDIRAKPRDWPSACWLETGICPLWMTSVDDTCIMHEYMFLRKLNSLCLFEKFFMSKVLLELWTWIFLQSTYLNERKEGRNWNFVVSNNYFFICKLK